MKKLALLFLLLSTASAMAQSGTVVTPAGSNPCTGTASSLQYNNSGSFGCVTGWTTNGSTTLVGGASTTLSVGAGTAITSSGPGGALTSAAYTAIGTSGATIPLLSGANTFGATQQIPILTVNGTVADAAAKLNVNMTSATDYAIVVKNTVASGKTWATGPSAAAVYKVLYNISDGVDVMKYTAATADFLFQRSITDSNAGLRLLNANTAGWGAAINFDVSNNSGYTASRIYSENQSTGGHLTLATAATDGTLTDRVNVDNAGQVFLLSAPGSDAGKTDAAICRDTTSGQLYAGSGAAGICLGTSSLRFKHDITPLTMGLSEVLALKPISYKYNKGYGVETNKDLYGFGAEDVAIVMPKLVGVDPEGKPNSVDWAGLVPVLVKAIQEQQAEIDTLKRQVER